MYSEEYRESLKKKKPQEYIENVFSRIQGMVKKKKQRERKEKKKSTFKQLKKKSEQTF